MLNNKDIYKIYQLMEFFTNKYSFDNVMVKEFMGQNEVWLTNKSNNSYNIIRISLSSLDETFSQQERINNFLNVIEKTIKKDIKFLDIHISNEIPMDNELYPTVCLNSNYYKGINVDDAFPSIKYVIHDVDNAESELASRISSINDSVRQRLNIQKQKFKAKFNLNATAIIIAICVINYLVSIFFRLKGYDSSACLIILGADYKMFTLGLHEFYRIITYAFVHSSIIHLGFNMYSLYFLGNYIERKYGTIKYLVILFTSIIFGALSHGILTDNQLIIGMSGGIYGLFIIYIIDALKHGAYQDKMFLFVIFLNIYLNFMSNVAWQTHIGGAIVGLLFYFIFKDDKVDYKLLILLIITFGLMVIKYLTLGPITPIYAGTDLQVTEVYRNLGFNRLANKLEIKLYNYYIYH